MVPVRGLQKLPGAWKQARHQLVASRPSEDLQQLLNQPTRALSCKRQLQLVPTDPFSSSLFLTVTGLEHHNQLVAQIWVPGQMLDVNSRDISLRYRGTFDDWGRLPGFICQVTHVIVPSMDVTRRSLETRSDVFTIQR